MNKIVALCAFGLTSCSFANNIGLTEPKACIPPMKRVENAPLEACITEHGLHCCGYAFLPAGHDGPICIHLVCQTTACIGAWDYYGTFCKEAEEPDQEAHYLNPDEYDDWGTHDLG